MLIDRPPELRGRRTKGPHSGGLLRRQTMQRSVTPFRTVTQLTGDDLREFIALRREEFRETRTFGPLSHARRHCRAATRKDPPSYGTRSPQKSLAR